MNPATIFEFLTLNCPDTALFLAGLFAGLTLTPRKPSRRTRQRVR